MHICDLPPELHAYIVSLACDEIPPHGELTSSLALSLLSSYWYSVSRPFKYHTVRVAGSHNIATLLSCLESLPERERRARGLSLSDTPFEEAIDEERLHRQKSNIARLVAFLSPSLYTLELRLANPLYATSLFALLWQQPFPLLEALSVNGYYPFPSSSVDPSSTNPTSSFPKLKHLSLEGVTNPAGLLSIHALDLVFPKLETLEVHGLRGAMAFANEVAEGMRQRDGVLKGEYPISETTGFTASLPGTLRRLVLFPAPEPAIGHSKRGHAMHAEMLKVVKSLTMRDVPETESALQVFVGESDTRGDTFT